MEKNFDLNVAFVPNELKVILEIINREDVESLQSSMKVTY